MYINIFEYVLIVSITLIIDPMHAVYIHVHVTLWQLTVTSATIKGNFTL